MRQHHSSRSSGNTCTVACFVAMAAFVTEWHTLDTSSGSLGGFADAGTPSAFWRLTTSISFSGQASWGYAVAAAVLFSATVWFSREQARDALDVLDELDESEGSGGSDGQS